MIQRFLRQRNARKRTQRIVKILYRFRTKLLAVYKGWYIRHQVFKAPIVKQHLQALAKSNQGCDKAVLKTERGAKVKQLIHLISQALESPRHFLTRREVKISNLSRYISKDPKREALKPKQKAAVTGRNSMLTDYQEKHLSKSLAEGVNETKQPLKQKKQEKRDQSRGRYKVDCWRKPAPQATISPTEEDTEIEVIPVVTTMLFPKAPPHDKIISRMRTVMDSVGKPGTSKDQLQAELERCIADMRLEFDNLCLSKYDV